RDYLPIVDAAYCAIRGEAEWLRLVADATRKTLDQGLGAYAVRYDCRAGVTVPLSVESGIRSELWRSIAITRTHFTAIQAAQVYNSALPVATLNGVLRGNELSAEIWGSYMLPFG